MNPPKLLQRLFLLPLVIAIATTTALAQPISFNDAIGDIEPGISTGDGTLDIVSMEVSDTVEDVIFKLTVNGNITTTDWGKFMVGIANQKTAGSTTGNGWGRPINLDAGGGNGMTHWIGSWVDGGGGSELWIYTGSGTDGGTDGNWSNTGATKATTLAAGTQSIVTYTVSKDSLGVATGDTIQFDAYSSGGGGGDSSVDALSNPNIAITSWGENYTSVSPVISTYTLSNSAVISTQDITFRVDMSFQFEQGNFDPLVDLVEVIPVDNTAFVRTDMEEVVGEPGVYEATVSTSAPLGSTVAYQFSIAGADADLPEDLTRNFSMPNEATVLPVVYFNNLQGFRDVTFSVDMSIQITAGTFDPIEGIVEVRGPFNDWAGTALTAVGDGVYSGTVPSIGGVENEAIPYKFWGSGLPNSGYETIDNRSFNLALNEDGSPTPALILEPTPNFDNATGGRNVTFTVDMTVMEALGLFTSDPDSVVKVVGNFNGWDTGGTNYQLADSDNDGVYTGTFFLVGNEDASLQYKFFSPGLVYYIAADEANTGFEIVNQADALLNRSGTLGPVDVPQSFDAVYFSNQLFGVMNTATSPLPLSSFTNFTTIEGTPSAAQSVDVSGLNLTDNVVATAPAGFELSLDGTTYSSSVSFVPTGGTLANVALFARVAASASAGVQTELPLLLTATGSQSTEILLERDVTPTTDARDITFSVDMSVQIGLGNFEPNEGVVEVRGPFNDWAGTALTAQGDGIYSGTVSVTGLQGASVPYKFYAANAGSDPVAPGYEAGSDRTVVLGPAGDPQNLPTVFFSNNAGESREVNFSVDMSVQIGSGSFNPNEGVVEVRGPFNDWAGTALTAQGAGIYSGTVSVPGNTGDSVDYKFYAANAGSDPAAPGYESFDGNRTFVLGPDGVLQILPTVFFNNDAGGETFSNWSGGQALTPALELEYAIGGASAPGADDGVASVTTVTADTLSITAVVRTNDPTLTVTGQALVDLAVGPWTTNNVTVTPQPAAEAPEGCEVQTFSTPNGTDGKKFLRLQTSLPAAP